MDTKPVARQGGDAQTKFQYSVGLHIVCVVAMLFALAVILFLPQVYWHPFAKRAVAALGYGYLIFLAWLYVWFSRNTFEISNDGLVISGPFQKKTISWTEITYMRWSSTLHLISFYSNSKRVATLGTDHLPGLRTLIAEVWARSNCELGLNICEVLTGQEPLPKNRWPKSYY